MNLAATTEERYRDLLARAEDYFRRVFPSPETRPSGIHGWLMDLEETRLREIVARAMASQNCEKWEDIDVAP